MTNPTERRLSEGRLAGKRVAITGTNRGIGHALACAAAQAGAAVIVHARTAAAAAAVAEDARSVARGARIASVAGDLRDPELGARLAATAREAFGGLDQLVLNAGALGPMQRLEETDLDAFREVMEINVDAQLRLFMASLPLLREARGAVIWMTSGLGHFALPRFGVYCASKHAVEGLMRLAACEHGEDGLTSVAVVPGMVQTEMLRAAMLGGDISEHMSPAQAAEGFVRLLAGLGPGHNGEVVDLAPYLPG